jgi:hypothetical protein
MIFAPGFKDVSHQFHTPAIPLFSILWGMLLVILLACSQTLASTRAQAYRTISTISPRPMAMGGAFVAVRDGLAALQWNPAAFTLYQSEVSHRVCVHINPVVPVLLLRKDHRDIADFLAAMGASFRGVTYSHRWGEVGLLLWEEPFYNPAASVNGRFFDPSHLLEHTTHTFGLRVRLARTVSLGSAGTLYKIRDEQGKSTLAGGINYGVLLQPARELQIGLAYFDFPSGLGDLREYMEGLADESVNGGFSLHPDDDTILAMDIRDVSGAEKIGWNRVRFGFERTFWERLALRLGYFQTGQREHEVYSFGIGLFCPGKGRNSKTPPVQQGYLANYALLVEQGHANQQLWHLFSVLFSI